MCQQQGQRPGGRRSGAGHVRQMQQPLPLMQPQILPRGRVHRYPSGHNMPDVPVSGIPGGMLPIPCDMGGMPFRDAKFSQPMQTGALSSALANATPEQRTLRGEHLYPLVDALEHDIAAKVRHAFRNGPYRSFAFAGVTGGLESQSCRGHGSFEECSSAAAGY